MKYNCKYHKRRDENTTKKQTKPSKFQLHREKVYTSWLKIDQKGYLEIYPEQRENSEVLQRVARN